MAVVIDDDAEGRTPVATPTASSDLPAHVGANEAAAVVAVGTPQSSDALPAEDAAVLAATGPTVPAPVTTINDQQTSI